MTHTHTHKRKKPSRFGRGGYNRELCVCVHARVFVCLAEDCGRESDVVKRGRGGACLREGAKRASLGNLRQGGGGGGGRPRSRPTCPSSRLLRPSRVLWSDSSAARARRARPHTHTHTHRRTREGALNIDARSASLPRPCTVSLALSLAHPLAHNFGREGAAGVLETLRPHTHTHTNSLTHAFSLTLRLTHTLTHTLSLCLAHTLSLTRTGGRERGRRGCLRPSSTAGPRCGGPP